VDWEGRGGSQNVREGRGIDAKSGCPLQRPHKTLSSTETLITT